MSTIFLGFTFLLAAIFPVGGYIAQIATGGMYGPIFGKFPPIFFHLFTLILSYVPMAVVSWIVLRKTNLATRLPDPPPGKGLLLAGVLLILVYLAFHLFASTIQGGGPSFVVASFAPYVIIPANICLVLGAAKVLLAASPNVS